MSVCVQTPCTALLSPLTLLGLGEAERAESSAGFVLQPFPSRQGFVFFSWKRCRSQRFGLAGFLWGCVHPLERRVFNPSSFPSPGSVCVGSQSRRAVPWLGTGRGCASPVWRAHCHQRAPGFFHETTYNFPGSAGGDGIVLPAVTDRAETEFLLHNSWFYSHRVP